MIKTRDVLLRGAGRKFQLSLFGLSYLIFSAILYLFNRQRCRGSAFCAVDSKLIAVESSWACQEGTAEISHLDAALQRFGPWVGVPFYVLVLALAIALAVLLLQGYRRLRTLGVIM